MKPYKLLLLAILASTLQACAGPGKPGEAPLTQPNITPSNDFIYRSPPADVARALQ